MKDRIQKYLPFLFLLIGGVRLFAELFPGKAVFLPEWGASHTGWICWTLGFAGIIWLILRAFSQKPAVKEKNPAPQTSYPARFFRDYGPELVILMVTAASLVMLIRSGYFWDDAVNSTAYLAEKKDAVPTFSHVLEFMQKYLKLGRLNVLSFYYYFFFYIENVSVYKALIIASILIDQLIFRKVLLEFDVPLPYARLGMLLIPLFLQTRLYQDPVSGFYSLMQVLTAEMLLCVLFLSRWLRSGKGGHLAAALLFFVIGLMTYEVCFPFLLLICLLILVRRKNFSSAVRGSLPFVVAAAAVLAGVFAVRKIFVTDSAYSGVSFSLDPGLILRTAAHQLSAGLPLSFYGAAQQGAVLGNVYPADTFMNYDLLSFLGSIRFSDLLILFIATALLLKIGNQLSLRENSQRSGEILLMGISFAVLPVITVAMSERYQGQLIPGLGYLPVYMQYYGIAMLVLWAVMKIRFSNGVKAVCLSAFQVILLLNLQNNRSVTEIMNRSFYDPRNAGEASLRGGILDFIPENAHLISLNDRRYLWESNWDNVGLYPQFYGNWARHYPSDIGDERLLRPAIEKALAEGAQADEDGFITLEPENFWAIAYSGSPDRGFTGLGRIRRLEIDPQTSAVRNVVTDHPLYFISGKFAGEDSVRYTTADGRFVQVPPAEQLRIRGTGSGILYQLPEEIQIWFDSLSPVTRAF